MPGLPSGGGGLYSTAADYLQLRADDAQRRRAEWQAAAEADLGRHDAHQRAERRRRSTRNRASVRCTCSPDLGFGYDFAVMTRSGGAQESAWQRVVLVVGHRRHVVLDRSGERHRVHRDDSAPRRRARRGEPRGAGAHDRLQGAGRSEDIDPRSFTPGLRAVRRTSRGPPQARDGRLRQRKYTGRPSSTTLMPMAARPGCVAIVLTTSATAATMNSSGVHG